MNFTELSLGLFVTLGLVMECFALLVLLGLDTLLLGNKLVAN